MAQALMSLEMTPKTPADREKLARGLQVLAAEDPHLDVRPGAEADRTVIGATSEAHLEEIIVRLKREFEVEASVSRPTVVYVETLARPAEGSAKHVTMSHGPGEYGHVTLRVYPAERGSGYTFEDSTVDGTIPKRFMASIDSGIRESMAKGVLNAYPIVDLRVEVDGGSYHDTDSTDAAFRSAAAMAFREAAKRAQPLVLEPVVQVVVRLEDTHINAVLEEFLDRKAEIQTRTRESGQEVITARVPLSHLFGFECQLRAQTHGHASCSVRFAYYQPVVQGPGDDDDHTSRVGVPRRPVPNPRSSKASVPEPDDSNTEV